MKNDYTKDDADISNKIRKRERYQISEAHDNYRNPNDKDAHLLLANYFESDEMTLFKKKWLEWHEDKENKEQGYKIIKSSAQTYHKKPPSQDVTRRNPAAWNEFLNEYLQEVKRIENLRIAGKASNENREIKGRGRTWETHE